MTTDWPSFSSNSVKEEFSRVMIHDSYPGRSIQRSLSTKVGYQVSDTVYKLSCKILRLVFRSVKPVSHCAYLSKVSQW